MSQGSLRLRLLLAAAAAILLALVLSGLVLLALFDRHLDRRVLAELESTAAPLLADLKIDADGNPVVDATPFDPHFELPGSGLYWQVSAGDHVLRSRSLWDESLPRPPRGIADGWSTRRVEGAFGQRVLLAERWVRLRELPRPVLVQVALEERQLLEARRQFMGEMALYLALLWIVLLVATWVQVQHGLEPLRTLREELSAMQQSPQARLSGAHPRELRPLTTAINELAELRERDLERARRRAADLAHSLKTPLAALQAVSRQVREHGAAAQADALDELVNSTSAAVEAELARARISSIPRGGPARHCAPLEIAERVVAVVARAPEGADIVFDVDIAPEQTLSIGSEDLLEILGALVENAARYASRRVRVSMVQSSDGAVLTVEDDGPGLGQDTAVALGRGVRLDQVGDSHHGLGLSIVRELVEATGGRITLGHASLGGLRVSLLWEAA